MKKLLIFVLILIRIYIVVEVSKFLYLSHENPQSYATERLDWWIHLLVFDIWLQLIIPKPSEDEVSEE